MGHGLDPLEWRMSSSVAGHLPDPLEVASSNEIEHGEILETQRRASLEGGGHSSLLKQNHCFYHPLI